MEQSVTQCSDYGLLAKDPNSLSMVHTSVTVVYSLIPFLLE